MAEFNEPVTSATLAQAMRTNPVVVRRMMAGLRREGYVRSARGHGGGWEIVCDLDTTTLLDIYRALGSPILIALGNGDSDSRCLVERAVESTLAESRREAEQVLLQRFSEVTLRSLSDEFHVGMINRNDLCLEQHNAV